MVNNSPKKRMKHFLMQLLIALVFIKGRQGFPAPDLEEEQRDVLVKLVEDENNPLSDIHFYQPFSPVTFYFDDMHKNVIKLKAPTKFLEDEMVVTPAKGSDETGLWQSVKSFFRNDVHKISMDIAENLNPLPPIVSVIDDVKRSDTWVDINSFFTKGYNRLIKFSKNVIDDLDAQIEKDFVEDLNMP